MTNRVIEPRFARVATMIGNPTRASMLARLLDGRHYTATELALHAGVSPPTASEHLKLLVEENLLRVRAQGRHRYFTLADGNVGHVLESLMRLADATSPQVALPETIRWQAPDRKSLRHARTCYGHLAGELGVRLCECFVSQGWVHVREAGDHEYQLNDTGKEKLKALGIASDDINSKNKRLLYACLDWSERRDHFAGELAIAMLDKFIERGWLKRSVDSRVLTLTTKGEGQFEHFLQ